MKKRRKSNNYFFLDIGATGAPSWARVGKATEWDVEFDPQDEVYDYIEDATPTRELTGYEVSVTFDYLADLDNALYKRIASMARARATGSDAHMQYMIVYEETTEGGARVAEQGDATIMIEDDNYVDGVINFNVSLNGTPVLGTASLSNGVPTFTADEGGGE
jgi:hypothetical protein